MSPELQTVSNASSDYGPIDINVAVAGAASDPLIVFVHGWPESWHSWQHQMAHLAPLGFRVAAIDVRGYGGSSRPTPIEAYRMVELSGDVIAVAEALSPDEPVVLVGHDWGAPIVYHASRLAPDRVRALAGMSVPYVPASPGDPMELWNALYEGRFFYMKYFQEPGVAEAAFEADLAAALRKVYYASSADGPGALGGADHPDGTAMLDILVDPDPAPAWMGADRFAPVLEANGGRSTHGWFNRYRAQRFDGDELAALGPVEISRPACFIGGAEDVVRRFVPGVDVFAVADANLADCRGVTIVDGAGHWVHQERPAEVNSALETFLAGL